MTKSKLFFSLLVLMVLTGLIAGSTLAGVPNEDPFGVALYDQQGVQFYVKDDTNPGPADRTFRYGPRNNDWLPTAGDWDGNGIYGVALYDQQGGRFYIKDNTTPGQADRTFRYGPRNNDWLPTAGDWDGNGIYGVALYDQQSGTFYVKDDSTPGPADRTFRYGPRNNDWLPTAGDWDGNGIYGVALYDQQSGTFYVKDDSIPGPADRTFHYGPRNNDWLPLAGKWVAPAEPETYNLILTATPSWGGTATDETAAGPYEDNALVEIKAEAKPGYLFVNWTAPAGTFANANNPGTTFTMPDENVTVTANFVEHGNVFIHNNPYENVNWDSVNQYKANFHTHTNESDGRHDPAYVIDEYHGAGYKILALTDHDTQGSIDPTWPWTNWDRDPETLGMLAIEGNEISASHHHLSLFNSWGAESTTIENSLLQIDSRDGLAILSHPGRYTEPLYYDYLYQPYPDPLEDSWYVNLYQTYNHFPLVGMEVYTLGNSYEYDVELWDRLNALLMPNITIFGYSVDDMHHDSQMFRNYQFMLMENLTEAALKEAMHTGAFYFCYEPDGSGAANPPVPRINRIEVTSGGTVISITATNADTITWQTDQGAVGSGSTIDLTTLYLDGDIFIRAELVNGSGITHTQPFVLGY